MWIIIVIFTSFFFGDIETSIIEYKFNSQEYCERSIKNIKTKYRNHFKNGMYYCMQTPKEWFNKDINGG